MEQLPLTPSLGVGRALGSREPSCAPSRSRYLLPPSAARREPGQLLHKATTPAPAQGGGSGLSPLAPTALSPWASLSRAGSQRPAPCAQPRGSSQPPPARHVSHTVSPAVIPTAVSPVPCRASRDMRTTRTLGCSGWAPVIASSPSGSARYSALQQGDVPALLPAAAVPGPQVLFWVACPP